MMTRPLCFSLSPPSPAPLPSLDHFNRALEALRDAMA